MACNLETKPPRAKRGSICDPSRPVVSYRCILCFLGPQNVLKIFKKNRPGNCWQANVECPSRQLIKTKEINYQNKRQQKDLRKRRRPLRPPWPPARPVSRQILTRGRNNVDSRPLPCDNKKIRTVLYALWRKWDDFFLEPKNVLVSLHTHIWGRIYSLSF